MSVYIFPSYLPPRPLLLPLVVGLYTLGVGL